MSNITHHLPSAGLSSHQNHLPNFRSAAYVREQSFKAQESLNTGLVIHTKEGDQVTLTSNSYSEVGAYLYDSKGFVQTESGAAFVSQNYREISLTSGQNFSFSVEGDLSVEELEDIESILQGLDEVITEMTQGDLEGALDKAVEMGDYDSVSSFAADISYQRSYEMRSATAAATAQSIPANGDMVESKNLSAPPPELVEEPQETPGKKNDPIANFDKFFKKMVNQFEAHDNKQVVRARNPINQLFNHHLRETEATESENGSLFTAIESAMNEIESLIDEMMGNLFGDQVIAESEETDQPTDHD